MPMAAAGPVVETSIPITTSARADQDSIGRMVAAMAARRSSGVGMAVVRQSGGRNAPRWRKALFCPRHGLAGQRVGLVGHGRQGQVFQRAAHTLAYGDLAVGAAG